MKMTAHFINHNSQHKTTRHLPRGEVRVSYCPYNFPPTDNRHGG